MFSARRERLHYRSRGHELKIGESMRDPNNLSEDIKTTPKQIEHVMIHVKIKLSDGKGKIRCW